MRNRILTLFLAVVMAFSLMPAASAAETPASSRNINTQDYTTWASTVKSYLYENSQGGVTRVEYMGGSVVVEDYDSAYSLTDSRTIEAELPIWGGFFAGTDANFLIFGQTNPGQSDSAEVIRVVKYSKDWQRQGQASLNGANTTVPFDAGSLRCDEYGGYLYIRTCHEMYRSSDGYNHQSNLTMAVRQSDMTITDSYYDVMNSSYGYISHSFNQFIIVDQDGKLVTLDHGDAYPRGVVFCKYYADAGTGKFTGGQYERWCAAGEMLTFAGAIGNNTTGGSVGGLAETTDCYVMTYNYDGQGGTGPRDAYYHYMDKASGKSWSVKLTNGAPGVTTPVLVPMGLSGGYVLWNGKSGYTPDDTLYYLAYGADGVPGETMTAQAPLSDCQPIAHDGKAVWYVTDNSAPIFYGLDGSGVTVLGGGSESSQTPDDPTTPSAPSDPGTSPAPDTPSAPDTSSVPSTPSDPYTPPSVEAEGRVWVLGETYGGDPGHDHYFTYENSDHRRACDDCSTGAAELYICRTCGAEWVSGIVWPREHSYSLTGVRQPTAAEPGERVYTCSYCGASYSEPFGGAETGTPASSGDPDVELSQQKLTVDGRIVDCEKYNIDGYNYFKLRDLAWLLKGTASQFAVGYDPASFTVTITSGAAYTPNGTEMTMGMDNSATAEPTRQTILIDGVERGDLSVYNIGGSNFFKLRDLGDALGFEVDYDEASNTAIIRSDHDIG